MMNSQHPAYMTQPSPAIIMNTPPAYGYNYSQHPSMQPYYPSAQPMQQPSGFMPQLQQGPANRGCIECCCALLCISACTYCCTYGCCPDDCGCCSDDPYDNGCC